MFYILHKINISVLDIFWSGSSSQPQNPRQPSEEEQEEVRDTLDLDPEEVRNIQDKGGYWLDIAHRAATAQLYQSDTFSSGDFKGCCWC